MAMHLALAVAIFSRSLFFFVAFLLPQIGGPLLLHFILEFELQHLVFRGFLPCSTRPQIRLLRQRGGRPRRHRSLLLWNLRRRNAACGSPGCSSSSNLRQALSPQLRQAPAKLRQASAKLHVSNPSNRWRWQISPISNDLLTVCAEFGEVSAELRQVSAEFGQLLHLRLLLDMLLTVAGVVVILVLMALPWRVVMALRIVVPPNLVVVAAVLVEVHSVLVPVAPAVIVVVVIPERVVVPSVLVVVSAVLVVLMVMLGSIVRLKIACGSVARPNIGSGLSFSLTQPAPNPAPPSKGSTIRIVFTRLLILALLLLLSVFVVFLLVVFVVLAVVFVFVVFSIVSFRLFLLFRRALLFLCRGTDFFLAVRGRTARCAGSCRRFSFFLFVCSFCLRLRTSAVFAFSSSSYLLFRARRVWPTPLRALHYRAQSSARRFSSCNCLLNNTLRQHGCYQSVALARSVVPLEPFVADKIESRLLLVQLLPTLLPQV
mmetsp:Transcript_16412/g.40546  ORF Transcript_16412/g.40546 Transcript_16412/m.40546 type:complete len:486 (-) Transcript_16412:596-2053(-)